MIQEWLFLLFVSIAVFLDMELKKWLIEEGGSKFVKLFKILISKESSYFSYIRKIFYNWNMLCLNDVREKLK